MTLIVGINCKDGVVIASDSAATFGTAGIKTIGQQAIKKIQRLNDHLLFSNTGAIGISQVLADVVKKLWDDGALTAIETPAAFMNKIGQDITQTIHPYLQTANLTRALVGDASTSLCKSMLAAPVKRKPCLFTFDYGGAPEQATHELPFVSMGSGQQIADPFLAFLKRLLWRDSTPSLPEGRFAAVWTINHVIQTNPGGVGPPIQLSTLEKKDKDLPIVTEHSTDEIQEHVQQIQVAEGALRTEIQQSGSTERIPNPPDPPSK